MNDPSKADHALAREIIGPYVVATSAEIHRAAVRIAAYRVAAVKRATSFLLNELAQTRLERDCGADEVTRLTVKRAKKRKT